MSHVPIRVSTLRGDQPIDFNAYVKINDKHILFLRKGDSFEGQRLLRLKEKKLKKMFIVPEDEGNYRKYLEVNIESAFDPNSDKPLETRVEIVQGATQSRTEEVMDNPDDVEAYDEVKAGAIKFVEFLTREKQALGYILGMENVDQSIAHHGVTVSSLSVEIANRLGITDPKLTQFLSVGALLHDFEHFQTPMNLNRPLSQFSPDELAQYKRHVATGMQKLQERKHFDPTVIRIVAEHEEYIDGRGFPHGLNESKMDPLSLIVGSANKLDRLLSFEKIPRKEVAKALMIRYTGCHPVEHLKILTEIIKSQ